MMNSHRCTICNRKVSAIDAMISCRCKEVLCKEHIYNHDCKFDYKKTNKEMLIKQLIPVKAEKIDHI